MQVKVIGTANPTFLGGETDLRGVFTVEGIHGIPTAVVRRDGAQYAFYRGKTPIGNAPAPNDPAAAGKPYIKE